MRCDTILVSILIKLYSINYIVFCFVDYIAALSSQSNYAESPYAAYSSRKRQQLAAAQAHHSRQRRKDDRLSNPIAERPEREVRTGFQYSRTPFVRLLTNHFSYPPPTPNPLH